MIDTHCHIDDEQYRPDLEAFVQQQQQDGVELILVPATDVRSCDSVLDVCDRYPNYLLPALGLHPEEVKEDWQEQLDTIYQKVTNRRKQGCSLIAIGEIGLDYHWDVTYKEAQIAAFKQQIEWALALDLPVMIHSRDATEDSLSILRTYASKGLRGVMHCYSGSHETAVQILEMGLYLGIGGVLTFKNCKLANALVGLPLDRIVLETDAPYMAPVPHRGERNESRWMKHVVEKLSEVYQISPTEIEKQTNLNAKCLFRL